MGGGVLRRGALIFGLLLAGCRTPDAPVATPAAVLVEAAPAAATLEERLEAAARDDEATKMLAAELALDVGACSMAEPWLAERVARTPDAAANARLMSLFLACPGAEASALFERLARSASSVTQRAGWRLAAARPGRAMARRIEAQLARALTAPSLQRLMTDEVAHALLANRVDGAYTFLRQALSQSGRPAFARAAAKLQPERLSDDAVAYLAKAPLEELKGGALRSVNVATCLILLEHFKAHPPTLGHPNFGHLFLYALSTRAELARAAQDFLLSLIDTRAKELAAVLSKMAPEVQIEYLRRVRLGAAVEASGKLARALSIRSSDPEVQAELSRAAQGR